jgi:hypothetical protein
MPFQELLQPIDNFGWQVSCVYYLDESESRRTIMKKLITFAFIGLAICNLVACRSMVSAILQDKSCSPPCWNQITPGQTSIQEISSKLVSIQGVDSKSIKPKSILNANDGISFKFLPYLREDAGELYSREGIIETISFGIKQGKISLSDALQEWGPPDQYISLYYSKVERPYLATSIIYTKRGIILDTTRDMSAKDVPKFEGNFPIQSVWYTDPAMTITPLTNGLLDNIKMQDVSAGLKPWSGFGVIDYIYR